MDNSINSVNKAAFAKVKAHLLAQNAQAMSMLQLSKYSKAEPYCVYRAEDGKQCAVGCLIPDEEYNPLFDALGSTNYWCLDGVQEACPSLRPISFALLSDVRHIHDAHDPKKWAALLDTLEMELIRNNYQHDACIFP